MVLQPRVVALDLRQEDVVRALDPRRRPTAEHDPEVDTTALEVPGALDDGARPVEVEGVRADLGAVARDVGAVLGDHDEAVLDLAEEPRDRRVLAPARRGERDPPLAQGADRRDGLAGHRPVAVEQGAVEVDDDEPDVVGARARRALGRRGGGHRQQPRSRAVRLRSPSRRSDPRAVGGCRHGRQELPPEPRDDDRRTRRADPRAHQRLPRVALLVALGGSRPEHGARLRRPVVRAGRRLRLEGQQQGG